MEDVTAVAYDGACFSAMLESTRETPEKVEIAFVSAFATFRADITKAPYKEGGAPLVALGVIADRLTSHVV